MRIGGTIDFIDLADLKVLVNDLFKNCDIKFAQKSLEDWFEINDDKYELYIYTTISDIFKKPRYLFEGEIKLPLEDSLKEIHRITNRLAMNNGTYCIAIYPVDGDDSIEIELRSIGYYKRYEDMRK